MAAKGLLMLCWMTSLNSAPVVRGLQAAAACTAYTAFLRDGPNYNDVVRLYKRERYRYVDHSFSASSWSVGKILTDVQT